MTEYREELILAFRRALDIVIEQELREREEQNKYAWWQQQDQDEEWVDDNA